jgi:hypothetical protein
MVRGGVITTVGESLHNIILTGDALMNWKGFARERKCLDRGTGWTLPGGSDGHHTKTQESPTDLESNQIFTEQKAGSQPFNAHGTL